MHYSNKEFSRNGGDTIQAIADPSMSLGNINSLSALDVMQINLLYKCPEALTQGTVCICLPQLRQCPQDTHSHHALTPHHSQCFKVCALSTTGTAMNSSYCLLKALRVTFMKVISQMSILLSLLSEKVYDYRHRLAKWT